MFDANKISEQLMEEASSHLLQAARLQNAAKALQAHSTPPPTKVLSGKGKRHISAAGLARIKAAQKKRWAKVRAQKKQKKT